MSDLLAVVVPVFLVLGFGYLSVRLGWLGDVQVDAIMRFAQQFALPVLLFRSIAGLDLGASFHPALLIAFYAGAFAGFFAGWGAARWLFGRTPEDAVAIGFACLFSNTLLLGLPLTERAYGPDALAGNYAIIALHSPLIYIFGITFMEFTRASGMKVPFTRVAGRALLGVARTPLVLGVVAGIAANVLRGAGLVLPAPVDDAAAMIARAGLPAALFGLGGVLVRYRPEGEAGMIAACCAISLVLHPAITWALGRTLGLSVADMRSAVVTAAMPPGVNAFMFAAMYGAGMRVAASTVLIGTALTLVTALFWLTVLP